MSDIVELLRQLMRAEMSHQISSHIGVVEAVKAHQDPSDLQNYGCDVRLRGRDVVLTGVPMITEHLGTVATPAVGDVVLVHFVGGDVDRPVIGGRLYSDKLQPPPYDAGQLVTFLPPDAGENDRIEFVMTGGKNGSRSLVLKLPADVTVTIKDKQVEATIGDVVLRLDAEKKQAEVQVPDASVVLKEGDVLVKTKGATVHLAGDKITLENDGDLTISSKGSVTIKAGADLKMEATGSAALKGADLKLGASGPAELKGAVVNIN